MGLTQKLGTIPLAIQTDSSNNVGIGGAANASYKLAVTGASLFSSTLNVTGDLSLFSGGTANNFNTYALGVANTKYLVFGSPSAAQPSRMWSGGIGADSSENIFTGAYNNYIFGTGSSLTERMRITSSGNVGIGTTSPDRLLHLAASQGTLKIQSNSTSGANIPTLTFFHAGNDEFIISGGNGLRFLSSGVTERMRITSGGNVLIGTTAGFNGQNLIVYRSDLAAGFQTDSGTGREAVRFWNGTTPVGTITTTASTTSYNTSSDYRLKQDLKEFKGLDLISAIKTYDYEWKSDKSRMYGVIAHELQEVLPYAVIGEKDGEQMQGVDYSKIVPVLVKAIQELNAKVTALENK